MSVRPRSATPRPLPVLVLADASGSMAEDDKIGVLNRSIAAMFRDFAAQDSPRGLIHVGAIAFAGEEARLHLPMTPAPSVAWRDLQPFGRTPIGAALSLATELLADDRVVPGRAFTPTVILVSDGRPTDEWQREMERFLDSKRGRGALRIAVGIGQDIDEEAQHVLETFVANPAMPVFRAQDVNRIPQFFRWVTMRVTERVHSVKPDTIPPLDPQELQDLI
ncbi:vWA domain-containing protein [Micromonospora sp. CPCC 205561]|uniref:vWA domain-containing protein n=1 Tax=Micromonospora sp. CPCC 205561 TaxID=3122407 RepID=UPI002FEFDA15